MWLAERGCHAEEMVTLPLMTERQTETERDTHRGKREIKAERQAERQATWLAEGHAEEMVVCNAAAHGRVKVAHQVEEVVLKHTNTLASLKTGRKRAPLR
jgi:hypothetical protein